MAIVTEDEQPNAKQVNLLQEVFLAHQRINTLTHFIVKVILPTIQDKITEPVAKALGNTITCMGTDHAIDFWADQVRREQELQAEEEEAAFFLRERGFDVVKKPVPNPAANTLTSAIAEVMGAHHEPIDLVETFAETYKRAQPTVEAAPPTLEEQEVSYYDRDDGKVKRMLPQDHAGWNPNTDIS